MEPVQLGDVWVPLVISDGFGQRFIRNHPPILPIRWRNSYQTADISFREVFCDPEHPAIVRQEYDSGDHIHPNAAGYAAMADLIPLNLLDGESLAKSTFRVCPAFLGFEGIELF